MGPPKCKTCGVAEWGHLCSGPLEVPSHTAFSAEAPIKAAISRKEYLKLKARERRARQKAAKA